MNFNKTENKSITKYRAELYKIFTSALDDMWQDLYIASSQAYLIEFNKQTIGYCCIDDKKTLLQIFLIEEFNYVMDKVIESLTESELISSASLSSIEPVSFNSCLAHSKSIKTNTYCFKYSNSQLKNESLLNIEVVSKKDIKTLKAFYKNHVGFDDTFGYVKNRVQRKELYMIKESGNIIATGECRLSDTQPDVADVGMAVNKDYRKKGIGTQVLQQMALKAQRAKRQAICSTTLDNKASKKAIEKAGFYCSHIIFDINFGENITKQ